MSNIVVNVDRRKHTEIGETRGEVNKSKSFVKKLLRLMSVDAEGFCESKDWPYLWSGQHKENRK